MMKAEGEFRTSSTGEVPLVQASISREPRQSTAWTVDQIVIRPTTLNVDLFAHEVYRRTCRTDFDRPGFCVVAIDQPITSKTLRSIMVELKEAMARIHEKESGKTLAYFSMSRFDQQTSTKPHLDGGPKESFLMLGYEPSGVTSLIEMYDFTKGAFDRGLEPAQFLSRFNPMFRKGIEAIRPYGTRLPEFSRSGSHIVCINNSSVPYDPAAQSWQGTLHTATILTPDESLRRVINSTLIASVPLGTPDTVSREKLVEFVESTAVARGGYDKPHLQDDI